MTSNPALKTRAKMLRKQLAQIDERLVSNPTQHPFADRIAKGPAALGELLGIIGRADIQIADRVLAVQAVSAILAQHGEHAHATSVLADLGTAADQHPAIRAAAGRGLLVCGNEQFTAAFEARLASPDSRVAAAAARAMGVARRTQAVEALIELFAKSESLAVQSEAAWALGEIGDPRGLEILMAAFKAERCLIPVIDALGKLGDEETLACMTVALRDGNADIRFAAAEAIYKLVVRHLNVNHSSLAPYLTETLEAETEGKVGIVIISCLKRIGAPIAKRLIQQTLTSSVRRGSLKSAGIRQSP